MSYFVHLQAGLGNQMFGYAFSKYLEFKTGESVKLSLSHFLVKQDHNGLELHTAFTNVKGISKKRYKLISFLYNILYNRTLRYNVYRVIRNIKYPNKICFWAKHPYSFYDVPIPQKKYYCGLWQNCHYTIPIRDVLINDFKFRLPNDGEYKIFENELLNCNNTVAIHIRRGDYLTQEYSNWNIFQDFSYFENAIEYLKKNFDTKRFFIFSDDINACKNTFKGNEFVFVDVNHGINSYLDMYLMSLATHIIISNSTFSWWAAFLKKKEGIVIAPKYWTSKTKVETQTFSPDNWLFF